MIAKEAIPLFLDQKIYNVQVITKQTQLFIIRVLLHKLLDNYCI